MPLKVVPNSVIEKLSPLATGPNTGVLVAEGEGDLVVRVRRDDQPHAVVGRPVRPATSR